MKNTLILTLVLLSCFGLVSAQNNDSTLIYKKRVLEAAEIDLLMSYYKQDGEHSAVGGGIGSEELTDITPTIVVSLPLNDDDVITIDFGISAYSSASSSNINPFNSSGASRGDDDDDDEDDDDNNNGNPGNSNPMGSPWVASSGASKSDELKSLLINYSHSSDNRNFIWTSNISGSLEYDYSSVGLGGSITKLFNEKNTEVNLKTQVYIDNWQPIYPTELHEFQKYGADFLNKGYFTGVDVLNNNGNPSTAYNPVAFSEISKTGRNSFSGSLFLSQIITKKLQAAIFMDIVYQKGLLSSPYNRVYFADKSNYFIGDGTHIANYTSRENTKVFQLADDIERLPGNRLKIPIGARINYYIAEFLVLRTYYRYYTDDWGISSNTASVELPVKITPAFTITPTYRFYNQTQADYYAPYEQHLSTEKYYTSDFDLAKFNSHQMGIGLTYTDVFTSLKLYKFGLKSINAKYSNYQRNDGLSANIISFGAKFVFE